MQSPLSSNTLISPTLTPHQGEAVWRYDDGTVYEGSWKEGVRHGRGVCFFPLSGNIYVGNFNQDKIDGTGSLFYRDGDFFHGEFRDGMCDGKGVFFSNGVEVRGEWRRGKRLNDPTSASSFDNKDSSDPMSEVRRDLHIRTFSTIMKALSLHFGFYMGATKLANNINGGGIISPTLAQQASVTWGDLGTTSDGGSTSTPPLMRADTDRLLATFKNNIGDDDASGTPLNLSTGGAATPSVVTVEGKSRPMVSLWGRDGINAPAPIPSSMLSPTTLPSSSVPAPSTPQFIHQLGGPEHTFEDTAEINAAAVTIPTHTHETPNSPKRITFVRPATCDPMLLFAVATPSFTEVFSAKKFLKRTVAMLFPILSLPHLRCSPFKITNNGLERELVVSGASVRIRPGVPRATLYISLAVLVITILGLSLDREELINTPVMDRDVQVVDIIAPFTGWFLVAVMAGGYHSYERVAHPLERMDRQGMPAMASFIASTIDSYSQVCVYTWDPLGNIRVSNRHYRYRWMMLSTILSLILALTSPVAARLMLGRSPFGTTDYSIASAVLLSFAVFLASSMMLYMVFKATDIQRQLLSQLSVLTSLAYVNGSSVLRPTTLRNSPFHFDDSDLSVKEKHRGVIGWMITRSYVVYANVVTNHSARASLMVPYTLYLMLLSILAIAYWASLINDAVETCELFSTYHALGAMSLLVHGIPLIRYMLVCATIAVENTRHLYLVDLALILHSSAKMNPDKNCGGDQACFELLKSHRGALEKHDYQPHMATIPITPAPILVVTLLMTLGFISYVYPMMTSLICYASRT